MSKYTTQIATVEGTGYFPVDMLRYDHCYPQRETDSISIVTMDPFKEKTIVNVSRFTERNMPWTDKRWESFGWRIIARREV